MSAHRVVVVGGGFGGMQAALNLRRAPVEVTLVDRRNFHLFQPLIYQVATGALSPGEIAIRCARSSSASRNVRVLLAEVAGFDLDARERGPGPVAACRRRRLPYDTLIVAGGSRYAYFGHDEWAAARAEVKSLESALEVRSRILAAFEAAEAEPDPERRARVADVRRGRRRPDRRRDGGPDRRARPRHAARATSARSIRARPASCSSRRPTACCTPLPAVAVGEGRAVAARLGRDVAAGRTVVGIDEHARDDRGAEARRADRQRARSSGPPASPASALAAALAELTGAELDRAGRVTVEPDLTLPGPPEVFALGDMVRVRDAGRRPPSLPGRRAGGDAAGALRGRASPRAAARARAPAPFRYRDKGNLATIGRAAAVADIKGSGSAASSPGSPGWSSTSSTWSASRTGCSCSSAGRSASSPAGAARG